MTELESHCPQNATLQMVTRKAPLYMLDVVLLIQQS